MTPPTRSSGGACCSSCTQRMLPLVPSSRNGIQPSGPSWLLFSVAHCGKQAVRLTRTRQRCNEHYLVIRHSYSTHPARPIHISCKAEAGALEKAVALSVHMGSRLANVQANSLDWLSRSQLPAAKLMALGRPAETLALHTHSSLLDTSHTESA